MGSIASWKTLLMGWVFIVACTTIQAAPARSLVPKRLIPRDGPSPPSGTPTQKPSDWWCSPTLEQGFFGFSYEVDTCMSKTQIQSDFKLMRYMFGARYVRLYASCDNAGFMDIIISAAYNAGIGVYALIWFGFNGGNQWQSRRDSLIKTVKTNPLAPYVIRSIDVGSEPLFDQVLSPTALAAQVKYVQNAVHSYGVNVSISEMPFGYTVQGNPAPVLNAIDMLHINELPFFDKTATTGDNAWPSLNGSISTLVHQTGGTKKVVLTQTGWPTNTKVWPANSKKAVANVQSSKAYADLLDSKCEEMKVLGPNGGIGWFWQIWSDDMLTGWGLIDSNGLPKWTFAPRTAC
ncbi:glycoside hydrolase superfamily [Cantharellus anzutake]|uniref:glycoside hydrolase superfamily n=1 Tax=Cantharellus anzutake TaxID=1750568 RepID=UPI00190316D0|nr:glycoside hydrolase superfamily [Cantharellus anzutake]KAF8328395.1 glycoside hydrolase superfamily [Cantharellus anzutake]